MKEDDSVVRARTTGHDEDGGEDRQRHQRWPYPFQLCHRDDFAEEVVFYFHNCVFRLLSVVCFVVAANVAFANSLRCLLRQGTENPSVAARRTRKGDAKARRFHPRRPALVPLAVTELVSYSVSFSDKAARWNGRASPCQAMARKLEGDLKQARASVLAHTPFKSDEGGRSEAVERRAKTHHRREDPIAWFGSAQSLAWGSSEHVFTRRAREGNVEHRL